MDARATTVEGDRPHPLVDRLERHLADVSRVSAAGVRVRDQGSVVHVECVVVPRDGRAPDLAGLTRVREGAVAPDWKTQDLVDVPVEQLPAGLLPEADPDEAPAHRPAGTVGL